MIDWATAAAAALATAWTGRALAHRAILHGLRAPRLAHDRALLGMAGPAHGRCEVRIPGPHGRQLSGWLVMPPAAATQPPRAAPAVLAMHGWGANASTMAPVVPPLRAAGFAVLLLDARCHGHSDDEAFTSMPRFAEDIAAGLAWLRNQQGIDGRRIALIGHSVGGAAALLHAADHGDVRAVVSLSAFAHPRDVMRRFMADRRVPYPVIGWYVMRHVQRVIGASFDAIAPLATLARVRCPVLLVHGRADTTVPFSDAVRLKAVSAGAALLAVDGEHDLRDALGPHAPTLLSFLRSATETPDAQPLDPAGAD